MKRFIGIIQFLTRIPIPVDVGFDEEFHKSTRYFPLVGLILGLCYYLVGSISQLFFSDYITAVLILLGTVVLTGGLHLDGVGDTFDGLYSYRDKERILEIMKDSRLGTNAMLSILFLILLKLGFLVSLLGQDKLWVVIIMPTLARTFQVIACYKGKTPRPQGMGNIFIGKVSKLSLGIAVGLAAVITVGVLLIFNPFSWQFILKAAVAIAVVAFALKLFERSVYKKIDGITGDILGCICEMAELGICIVMYFI